MEDFAARVEAELRGKAQLVSDGALAGAQAVQPDISPDQLWEELVADDALRALMLRVLDATKYTARKDKVWWLGAILGRAAVEKERIDELGVLVSALNDLEGPHAEVLAVLDKPGPFTLQADEPTGWTVSQVAGEVPFDEGIVRACLGTISRHGLARDAHGPFSHEVYMLTTLGQALLAVMRLPGPDL